MTLIAPPAVIKRDQIAMACAALTEAIVEVESEIRVNQ